MIAGKLLCQKNIHQDNGSTTYCMRPMNHREYDPQGKCAISPTDVDKKFTLDK